MKKLIRVACIFAVYMLLCSVSLSAKCVDKRFELAGVIWCLSSMHNDTTYNYLENNYMKNTYRDVMVKYFMPYKNHRLVSYVSEMRNKGKLSYSEFISAMNCAQEIDNKLSFDKLKSYTTSAGLSGKKLATLIKDFYQASDFDKFFSEHSDYYEHVEKIVYENECGNINVGWFADNLGIDLGDEKYYICVSNGTSCFFSDGLLIGIPMVSYYNVMYDQDDFRKIVYSLLYTRVEERLKNEPYLPEKSFDTIAKQTENTFFFYGVYLNELHDLNLTDWITRIFTLMYWYDNDSYQCNLSIAYDMRHGYIWQKRAMKFMENYVSNRVMYHTLWEFVPQMLFFIDFTAQGFEYVMKEYRAHCISYVTEVFPAPGSYLDLEQDSIVFTVKFSERMQNVVINSFECDDSSWSYTDDAPTSRWKDDYTYQIVANTGWIKKSGFKGFEINSFFTNIYAIPLNHKLLVTYKVKR